MINYGRQSLDSIDYKEVLKVLKSDFITQGKTVNHFENKISRKFGSKYCTAVSSGTAALHLAGLSLGWKKNDIIITMGAGDIWRQCDKIYEVLNN